MDIHVIADRILRPDPKALIEHELEQGKQEITERWINKARQVQEALSTGQLALANLINNQQNAGTPVDMNIVSFPPPVQNIDEMNIVEKRRMEFEAEQEEKRAEKEEKVKAKYEPAMLDLLPKKEEKSYSLNNPNKRQFAEITVPEEKESLFSQLKQYTKTDLNRAAKRLKVRNYSKMNKDELIGIIIEEPKFSFNMLSTVSPKNQGKGIRGRGHATGRIDPTLKLKLEILKGEYDSGNDATLSPLRKLVGMAVKRGLMTTEMGKRYLKK